jgi:hypothetical protein
MYLIFLFYCLSYFAFKYASLRFYLFSVFFFILSLSSRTWRTVKRRRKTHTSDILVCHMFCVLPFNSLQRELSPAHELSYLWHSNVSEGGISAELWLKRTGEEGSCIFPLQGSSFTLAILCRKSHAVSFIVPCSNQSSIDTPQACLPRSLFFYPERHLQSVQW